MTKIESGLRLPAPWLRLLEPLIWGVFLVLLICISFQTEHYSSSSWLLPSAVLFGLAGFYLVVVILGGHCAVNSIVHAKWVIAIMASAAVWLFLQWQLPVKNTFYSEVFGAAIPVTWFQPEYRLSIVPERTKWLFLSAVFELTLFCLSLCLVGTRSRVKQILWVLLVIGGLHAAIAVVAKYGGFHLTDLRQLDGHYTAARGLFVNRNHMASFVSLGLFGALCFQIRIVLQRRNIATPNFLLAQLQGFGLVYIVAILLGLIAILLSQSRAGFIGVAVGLLVAVVVFARGSDRVWLAKKVGVFALVVLAVLLLYFGQDLMQRLGNDTLSIGERGSQWVITWQAIKQNIIVGYGAGSYATVFQIWREYTDLRYVVFDQSHNYFLHLWLEQGLIGLCLWLALLSVVIHSAVRSAKRTKSTLTRSVLIAGMVVISAALFQSIVDFNLQIMNIRCYFFVIIALTLSVQKLKDLEPVGNKKTIG